MNQRSNERFAVVQTDGRQTRFLASVDREGDRVRAAFDERLSNARLMTRREAGFLRTQLKPELPDWVCAVGEVRNCSGGPFLVLDPSAMSDPEWRRPELFT
jgi:hypothetical protein